MTSIERDLDPQLSSTASLQPKRRSWRGLITRIAGGALGLVALTAAAGAAYEQIAGMNDAAAYPPPGQMVDVGGYKLHLDCRGQGSPTVVMDAGLGAASLDWTLVQPELARTTRVCAYDRAGMGWSEPGPKPRSPAHLAEELHTLLRNGGVPGPYVMVGHSLAGKTIRMFAADHPAEVAGMVLVDARSELVDTTEDMSGFAAALQAQAAEYWLARQFGIARLLGARVIDLPLVPPALATQMALFVTSPAAIAETTEEGLNRVTDDKVLASASLGSLPLVVVAAGESMRSVAGWPAAQAAMARLSTNGRLVVAGGSSHAVHLVEPDVVIEAAMSVIADVRAGGQLGRTH